MIRTAWFYLVLVWSSVIHAGGVLIAALLGVKRRPGVGAGGIYDWGASDWGRDLIAWLDDAVRRRAPTQEVEAHLREIGMTEEQAAPFVAQHMANLHARKK